MTRKELLQIAKPILFNTEMVKAILEGRKTVTRRCVKPKSKNACGFFVTTRKSDGAFMGVYDYDENEMMFDSPQTQPAYVGDILYIRESVFQGVGHYLDVSGETVSFLTDYFEYYADGVHKKDHWKDKHENVWMHRRPSIHMPKEATRVFLKVKDVRVERLQEITEKEAQTEGCIYDIEYALGNSARGHFTDLWDSTIKKSDLDTYGWEANPYVWVIEFEKVEVQG